jgi:hypothetical protein
MACTKKRYQIQFFVSLQKKARELGAEKKRRKKKKKQNLCFALAEGPVHHIEILFASPHSYHLSLFCQE